MKAAVLKEIREISIEDWEEPTPKPNEVLIRMKSVGVCGSDVAYFAHGRIGDQIVKGPHILGHECAGEVVEVGKEVNEIETGTRVAIEPGIPCRKCHYCRIGRYNICPNVQFLGTPPVGGGYRELIAYPRDFVFPLPGKLNYEDGAMVETLSVGVHAVDLGEVQNGDSVAILGTGSVGLLTLQCAISAGATFSIATDIIPERLEVAKGLGADVVINAEREDPVKSIKESTRGEGADIVFEAAGETETFKESVEAVRIGGTVVLIGICEEDMVEFDFHTARKKELVIKNVRRFRHTYPRAISLMESGRVDAKKIVTHRFELHQLQEALELVEEREDGVIKAVINV